MRAAIKSVQESGGFQGAPEEEAYKCGACKVEADASEEGRRAPPRAQAAPPFPRVGALVEPDPGDAGAAAAQHTDVPAFIPVDAGHAPSGPIPAGGVPASM